MNGKRKPSHGSREEEPGRGLPDGADVEAAEDQTYDELMTRLSYAKAPRKLTRDELNERQVPENERAAEDSPSP